MTVTDDRVRTARRVYARHRRRRGETRCTFCSGVWRLTTNQPTGHRIDGCAARQVAGRALDAVGQLDEHGRPTLPVALVRPVGEWTCRRRRAPRPGMTLPSVAPMSAYWPGSRVWVYRGGGWRPGQIVQLSSVAALVRYRPTEHRGTGTDTMLPDNLAARDDVDRFLDDPGSDQVP